MLCLTALIRTKVLVFFLVPSTVHSAAAELAAQAPEMFFQKRRNSVFCSVCPQTPVSCFLCTCCCVLLKESHSTTNCTVSEQLSCLKVQVPVSSGGSGTALLIPLVSRKDFCHFLFSSLPLPLAVSPAPCFFDLFSMQPWILFQGGQTIPSDLILSGKG